MKRAAHFFPLFLILAVPLLNAQQRASVTLERLRGGEFPGDSLAVRSLDPAADLFPDASLIDFGGLLDRPAGARGFVRAGKKGRLEFKDGTPARFWGVVIGDRSLNAPKYLVEKVIETLARAGVNLVRLCWVGGQSGRGELVDRDILDRIDYWIAAAKKKGIYCSVALDVVDSLESVSATFSKRFFQIQKTLIESIAGHKNAYTGIEYAEDPAIAFFEFCRGKNLLSEPIAWTKMPEPYWKEFNALWNGWLEKQYRSTTRLRASWTNASGIVALTMQESLEKRNIRLPTMDDTPFDQAILAPYHDPLRSPARRSDAVRFALALQRLYYEEMSDYAERSGIRVPILAGMRNDLVPVASMASQILGVAGGESYYDHPTESSRKEFSGLELFLNRNPLTERGSSSFAPNVARMHWSGSPAGVRAWTACWPNAFRSAGVLEVAAYSLFQGVDLVVHDNYLAIGDVMSIGTHGLQADPSRWGLFGMAAKMFLSGDIREAKTTVAIAYSDEDLATFASYDNALYELAWTHKVVNRLPQEEAEEVQYTITSGRSHVVELNEENSVLYSRSPLVETKKQQVINERNSIYSRSGYPLKVYVLRNDSVRIVLDSSTAFFVKPRFAFRIREVAGKGLVPVGADPSGTYTAGFLDTAKNILGLGGIVDAQVGPIILQHINRKSNTGAAVRGMKDGIYESDTRELVRNVFDGILVISAPEFASVQGAFKSGVRHEAGALDVTSASPAGTVAATSLDGKPLTQASRILIKMVTVAENTGQRLDSVNVPGIGKRYTLRARGGFPVDTKGAASEQPTSIWLNGRKILDVYMQNGTWEAVLDLVKKEYLFYCDTPGIRFHLFPDDSLGLMRMERYFYSSVPAKEGGVSADFRYPGTSKYIRLTEERK